ncbi:MAG: DUF692 domain-containing protein [Verrucomicrobia bacterium]|nr:DUF692 domain-containing protein [Verrucomicrobiota bacterium]
MIEGIGIGLPRELAQIALGQTNEFPGFLELAPENWMGVKGRWGRILEILVERYPITCHALSLSLGGQEPLDWNFLCATKLFLKRHRIDMFSDHLASCRSGNYPYDLSPLSFDHATAQRVVSRIRYVQNFLERRIAIEPISYLASSKSQMDESTFICNVLEEANCDLVLDLTSVYVNAHNHSYDPKEFITSLPLERVVSIHIGGHEGQEFKVNSRGSPIGQEVLDLFSWTIGRLPAVPVVLEREYNFLPYTSLMEEMRGLQAICDQRWEALSVQTI